MSSHAFCWFMLVTMDDAANVCHDNSCTRGSGSRWTPYASLASKSFDSALSDAQLLAWRKDVEQERLKYNREQPTKAQKFTDKGFKLVSMDEAAPEAWGLIHGFYQRSANIDRVLEEWPPQDTYVNHWEVRAIITNTHSFYKRPVHEQSPTYMVNLPEIREGASETDDGTLKYRILEALQPVLEQV